MPKREYLKRVAGDAIVKVVPDARERYAAHARQRNATRHCTQGRLNGKQAEDAIKIFKYRIWSRWPVRKPPRCRRGDLRPRVLGDLDSQGST
jgi:hypothetical protein